MKRASNPSPEPDPPAKPGQDDFSRRVVKVRHDIRNPLSHIMGFTELLMDAARKLDHVELQLDLDLIYQHSETILSRVNASLDATQLKADARSLAILQTDVTKYCALVAAASRRIGAQSAIANDPILSADLKRIIEAAEKLSEITPLTLSSLHLPASSTSPVRSADDSLPALALSPTNLVQIPSAIRAWKDGAVLLISQDRDAAVSLEGMLGAKGYRFRAVSSFAELPSFMAQEPVDLLLLDLALPDQDVSLVLQAIKSQASHAGVPCLLLASERDSARAVNLVGSGADDFLNKPLAEPLVISRVGAVLAQKRLHDQERALLKRLQAEQERSQRLLTNILPDAIAQQLKQGHKIVAQSWPEVVVFRAGLAGFSALAEQMSPQDLLACINDLHERIDPLFERAGFEKVKTAIDCYLAIRACSGESLDFVIAAADLALSALGQLVKPDSRRPGPWHWRVGLASGQLFSGIVGTRRFVYDVWGPALQKACELEVTAAPNMIVVTSEIHEQLQALFHFDHRKSNAKGKDQPSSYSLLGRIQD